MDFGIHGVPTISAPWILRDICIFQNKKLNVGENFLLATHSRCRFSHVQLCDPMDGSPPGFSVHQILQARIQEWVAIPSSRGSF